MKTWIALLRGINVGGKNILPMSELKRMMELAGCLHIRTYIQSGNVVFKSDIKDEMCLAKNITQLIVKACHFEPQVFLLSKEDLESAIKTNPYASRIKEPKSLHFYFLGNPATAPNMKALEAVQSPTESFELTNKVFYLLAPDGVGRSKLAANVERHLGVAVTARNYRTIQKLHSMMEGS